jgi:hypothetical protein
LHDFLPVGAALDRLRSSGSDESETGLTFGILSQFWTLSRPTRNLTVPVAADATLERVAYHESGHVIAAINFGIPVIRVTIELGHPHLHRGAYKQTHDLAVECLATLWLSGPAAEELIWTAAVRPISKWRATKEGAMTFEPAISLSAAMLDPNLFGKVF